MPENTLPGTLESEVARRRTFAIISHPDAGKTTMTEKLLLYSGAIRTAGSVKARKSDKHATSDWMEIEKQRGISVTSSAMQFEFDGFHINILDTPGHQDFSEDTYRVLVAADSAVMMIDAAKGVEAQTIKLFKVCRLRNIPIFTFVNKMDRAAKDPFSLMEEIEQVLGIRACPINWPIGTDGDFKGVYHRDTRMVELYESGDHGKTRVEKMDVPVDDPSLPELLGDRLYTRLMDEIELLDMAGDEFDLELVRAGELTPMFFGSAITNFGVEPFLSRFLDYSTPPASHESDQGVVEPTDPDFSGFIFKIQANMNPQHRDRIAFVRVCSGEFSKGLDVTLARTGKPVRLNNAVEFESSARVQVSEAVAGDIVGLYDTGNFQIGDSIYAGKHKVEFAPLPEFTPELFMRVSPKNVMKQKSFHKGMNQLVQEGAVQLYRNYQTEDYILGAVGQLQFEVFQYRMKNEYNSDVEMTSLGHRVARWIDPDQLDPKMSSSRNLLVKDRFGNPLFLFENAFAERWFHDKYPDVKLTEKL